jgi:hypothetical protein
MRPHFSFILLGFLSLAIPTAAAPRQDIVPAGTAIMVRTMEPIYADYVEPGMRVQGIVDEPVDAGGLIVVPRGARATLEIVGVERSSTMKGRDRITFMLNALHMNGRTYPVAASYAEVKGPSEGKRAAGKIIGGAGIGAALGGIFGGGTGAAIGAATGGATGAMVAGSGKKHLVLPSQTRLLFRLNSSTHIGR